MMKSILALIAITLLTSGAFAQNNPCKVIVEIYEEHSRETATKIAQEFVNKTNGKGYVLNVIAAEIKKCQEKNVRERWTAFSPKYTRCRPTKTYIHTKPMIISTPEAKKECSAVANQVLFSKGFKPEDIGVRQSNKPSQYPLRIILPPYSNFL